MLGIPFFHMGFSCCQGYFWTDTSDWILYVLDEKSYFKCLSIDIAYTDKSERIGSKQLEYPH